MPKLIIQPIIENAIKYGLRECGQMLVQIRMALIGNELVITITNNGSEIDEPSLAEICAMLAADANHSQHSGLYNVNRRIQLMYGGNFGVKVTSSQQTGTTVTIGLPIHR